MPITHTPLEDVLENYRCYLSRNGDLAGHYAQYMKRVKSDPKAAEAEAVVFSWLRAEKRNPHIHEDTGTGGPDFQCEPASGDPFLVEVTSLDSEMVSKRSGLPVEVSGSGAGAYGLLTQKLKAKAKEKAGQLSDQSFPSVLAIVSDHGFASILMDKLPAEYLMTSAPTINVAVGGQGPTYITHDFKDSVFQHRTGLVWASGAPIVRPALRSVSAILLIASNPYELGIVGLLHPDAVRPFCPQLLSSVPFVKHTGVVSFDSGMTKWLQAVEGQGVATFAQRHLR
jgi:hypothetical protein